MFYVKKVFLIIYTLAFIFSINGHTKELKIVSWNIFTLPFPLGKVKPYKRMKKIVEIINKEEIDIISFQEAFSPKVYRYLLKKLKRKFPYSTGKPHRGFRIVNSGLITFSKYPIVMKKNLRYDVCVKVDCFAAKSALLTRIQLDKNKFIDVMNTHMQASGASKGDQVRIQQLAQINYLITKYRQKNTMQILLGDFNIDRHRDELYPFILKMLDVKDLEITSRLKYSSYGCLNTLKVCRNDTAPSLLDHIFYIPNGSTFSLNNFSVTRWVAKYRRPKPLDDLSDHFAVQANLIY